MTRPRQGGGIRPDREGKPVLQVEQRGARQDLRHFIPSDQRQEIHILRGPGVLAQTQLQHQAALQEPGVRPEFHKAGKETVEDHQLTQPDQWHLRLGALACQTIFQCATESGS